MADFNLTNAYSPMLFTVNGYKLVVMPMLANEANEQMKRDKEAKAKETEPETEAKPAKSLRIPAPMPIKMRRNMLISTPGNTAKLIMRDYFLHVMINPEFKHDISPVGIE